MKLLESVKKATLSVLSETPDDELKYKVTIICDQFFIFYVNVFRVITLPILREKVANVMDTAIEEFLGKDIKLAIMETFQEFSLKGSDDKVKETEESPKKPAVKKSKTSGLKKESESEAKKKDKGARN